MRQKGIFLSVGVREPRLFLFDGGQEVIDFFLSRSPYDDFDIDVDSLSTKYVKIVDLRIIEFLNSVDGGLCGNYCGYLFDVSVESDMDVFSKNEIDKLDYIEFYKDANSKPAYTYSRRDTG